MDPSHPRFAPAPTPAVPATPECPKWGIAARVPFEGGTEARTVAIINDGKSVRCYLDEVERPDLLVLTATDCTWDSNLPMGVQIDAGTAVPATTPVCHDWCGKKRKEVPDGEVWTTPGDKRFYCTFPCMQQGRPRRPPPTQTPEEKP